MLISFCYCVALKNLTPDRQVSRLWLPIFQNFLFTCPWSLVLLGSDSFSPRILSWDRVWSVSSEDSTTTSHQPVKWFIFGLFSDGIGSCAPSSCLCAVGVSGVLLFSVQAPVQTVLQCRAGHPGESPGLTLPAFYCVVNISCGLSLVSLFFSSS